MQKILIESCRNTKYFAFDLRSIVCGPSLLQGAHRPTLITCKLLRGENPVYDATLLPLKSEFSH
jgi:hypothetical protein